MASYENRLQRLEQQARPPPKFTALVFWHDSDTRPADYLEVSNGERVVRKPNEDIDAFRRRAYAELGVTGPLVLVIAD